MNPYHCTDIAVDAWGSIVVSGHYWGQVDFNPSAKVVTRLPNVTTDGDGFVAKLSPTGALTWVTPLGGAYIESLALDASGNVYTTGSFYGVFTPGFGLPTSTSNGGNDAFVTQLSSSGAVNWAVTFGGTSSDAGYAVAVDASGTVYVTGSYRYTVDFDSDASGTYELSSTWSSMFLMKLKQK